MDGFGRFLQVTLAVLVMMIATALAFVVLSITRSGMMTVDVREHDARFGVRFAFPAVLVQAAADAAGWCRDIERLSPVRSGAEDWHPVARVIAEELIRMPDATLVEIRNEGERVTISKKRGGLRIDFEDDDIDLRIALPARTFRRVVAAALL